MALLTMCLSSHLPGINTRSDVAVSETPKRLKGGLNLSQLPTPCRVGRTRGPRSTTVGSVAETSTLHETLDTLKLRKRAASSDATAQPPIKKNSSANAGDTDKHIVELEPHQENANTPLLDMNVLHTALSFALAREDYRFAAEINAQRGAALVQSWSSANDYDWSEWEEVPDSVPVVHVCLGQNAVLGLNTDGGSDGTVYIEAIEQGTWASQLNLELPCKLQSANFQKVQSMPSPVFIELMKMRPLRLSFRPLRRRLLKEGPQPKIDPLALQAPHLVTRALPIEYELVIPTYKRWQPTKEIIGRKRCLRCENPDQAFILNHTLSFLAVQGIAQSRVTLFVADDTEAINYKNALQNTPWANVKIRMSAPGIRDSRNAICKSFPEGTYVVSLDDDLEGIYWKIQEDSCGAALTQLPPGGFEKLIFDAYQRMVAKKAFLWGVNTSSNPRCMQLSGVSQKNGLVNGYIHGFICRPLCTELFRTETNAVEDCEFSVRHFAKDGVVLRYKMYAGMTSTYKNQGGLQAVFQESDVQKPRSKSMAVATELSTRKLQELQGAQKLHKLFPHLIAPPMDTSDVSASSESTMQVKFISIGSSEKSDLRRNGMAARARRMLGPRARICSLSSALLRGDTRILYQKPNPKRPGSRSYARYQKYMHAKTVAEAQKMGAQKIDLRFDHHFGYLKLKK